MWFASAELCTMYIINQLIWNTVWSIRKSNDVSWRSMMRLFSGHAFIIYRATSHSVWQFVTRRSWYVAECCVDCHAAAAKLVILWIERRVGAVPAWQQPSNHVLDGRGEWGKNRESRIWIQYRDGKKDRMITTDKLFLIEEHQTMTVQYTRLIGLKRSTASADNGCGWRGLCCSPHFKTTIVIFRYLYCHTGKMAQSRASTVKGDLKMVPTAWIDKRNLNECSKE